MDPGLGRLYDWADSEALVCLVDVYAERRCAVFGKGGVGYFAARWNGMLSMGCTAAYGTVAFMHQGVRRIGQRERKRRNNAVTLCWPRQEVGRLYFDTLNFGGQFFCHLHASMAWTWINMRGDLRANSSQLISSHFPHPVVLADSLDPASDEPTDRQMALKMPTTNHKSS